MEKEHRIYCIEGYWDWGGAQFEPSVEPILQMLQKMGQYAYARRDCATTGELEFWLGNEWKDWRKSGSILYIASHGSEGCIWLGSKNSTVSLYQIAEIDNFNCENCLVHFSGCKIFAGKDGEKVAQDFMERTGASFVTGYTKEVYWASEQWAPAVALDLILFSSIRDQRDINFRGPKTTKRSIKPMRDLVDRLKDNEIFKKCGLRLFVNNEAY